LNELEEPQIRDTRASGLNFMMRAVFLAAVGLCLAGCAAPAPPSTAAEAEDTACTAQGDAVFNANTVDEQARTGQNGLLYGATPTHVFDAEHLGAEHLRQSDITNCEQNGDTSGPDDLGGPPPVMPHIIGNPSP
jgi:hypothetical protein